MANDDEVQYEEENFSNDDTTSLSQTTTEKVCKVFDSEDFFTVFVQIMLAFFALLSLWFKRQNERPKRKFNTWFLDVSKQGVGAGYAHVLNMIIASILVENGHGSGSLNDQCAWYGMIYMVDTTLGLLLAIWGLKAMDWFANKYDWSSLKNSGVYGGVDGFSHWIHQVMAWLFILTVVKVIVYYFLVWTADALAVVGSVLFAPIQGNIRFELLFVMIVFPGLLNVIYFWVADHFLKAGSQHAVAHEEDTLDTELASKAKGLLKDEDNDNNNNAATGRNGDQIVLDGPKIWVHNDNINAAESASGTKSPITATGSCRDHPSAARIVDVV